MRVIGLAVVLAVGVIHAPLAAVAQQVGKVYRIGVLSSGSSIPDDPGRGVGQGRQAFLERLSDLGWGGGQNLTFEPRSADQRVDPLPLPAREFVQRNARMILAFGNPAGLAAKPPRATLPISEIRRCP